MNKYVFDNGPLRILIRHFYEKRFPTLWDRFDFLIKSENLFSVREVFKEIERKDNDLLEWAQNRHELFLIPTEDEMLFVKQILAIPHFQQLITKEQQLTGYPAADPFVIACAKIKNAVVVTTEKEKPHSAKIPNVCKHFHIPCIGLEEFMEKEGWKF
jgi:hypothetical protein